MITNNAQGIAFNRNSLFSHHVHDQQHGDHEHLEMLKKISQEMTDLTVAVSNIIDVLKNSQQFMQQDSGEDRDRQNQKEAQQDIKNYPCSYEV